MQTDLVRLPSLWLERLSALGIDVARALGKAKISLAHLEAHGRVTTHQCFTFWQAAQDSAGARDIGLRLGVELVPHQLSVASIAALHSPNLGEALKKLARYKRLVSAEQIVLDAGAGEARVRFHWLVAEHPPAILVDGMFASVVALARRGTGKPFFKPRRVELTRRRADEAMLKRHFGCEIRFDASFDLVVLDGAALDEPFVTHNEELLAVLLPSLEAALDEEAAEATLVGDVRTTLLRRMDGGRPSLARIAEELRMSPRTLQRHLGQAGTSYQELLDGVRRQAARRLLTNTDLDASEVAFLLGFEEFNSFTRAFRAWEGTTPNRWREMRRTAS